MRRLALTHLIPPPPTDAQSQAFADDLRAGGYAGPVDVGPDPMRFELPAPT